jgi:hypothetical protein
MVNRASPLVPRPPSPFGHSSSQFKIAAATGRPSASTSISGIKMMGSTGNRWQRTTAGALALALSASVAAAPFVPADDGQVLERRPIAQRRSIGISSV